MLTDHAGVYYFHLLFVSLPFWVGKHYIFTTSTPVFVLPTCGYRVSILKCSYHHMILKPPCLDFCRRITAHQGPFHRSTLTPLMSKDALFHLAEKPWSYNPLLFPCSHHCETLYSRIPVNDYSKQTWCFRVTDLSDLLCEIRPLLMLPSALEGIRGHPESHQGCLLSRG